MGLKSLLSNISGRSGGREEFAHPITGMAFEGGFVVMDCANSDRRAVPYNCAYMSLSHFGAHFIIKPADTDTAVSGVDDIAVDKYLDKNWIIRCDKYLPDMNRLIPDCWGFDTPYFGNMFICAECVYAKKTGATVVVFTRNGAHAVYNMQQLNFVCNIDCDDIWYECRCGYDHDVPYIKVVSSLVITLGEALTELREVPINEICIRQKVFVDGDVYVVGKSDDTRDGWMLWLEGERYSMWYTKPTVSLISDHVMLPVQYDAAGNPIRKFHV